MYIVHVYLIHCFFTVAKHRYTSSKYYYDETGLQVRSSYKSTEMNLYY